MTSSIVCQSVPITPRTSNRSSGSPDVVQLLTSNSSRKLRIIQLPGKPANAASRCGRSINLQQDLLSIRLCPCSRSLIPASESFRHQDRFRGDDGARFVISPTQLWLSVVEAVAGGGCVRGHLGQNKRRLSVGGSARRM